MVCLRERRANGGLDCGEEIGRAWESQGYRDWEGAASVKYFTNISSVKHFTQICLGWFGWLKIFYFGLNILQQNKHCKMWKYFPKNILHQNKRSLNISSHFILFYYDLSIKKKKIVLFQNVYNM